MTFLRIPSFLFTLFAVFALTVASCTKDDACADKTCPAGFVCDDGVCIPDATDLCANVSCDPGYTCVNGNCVQDVPVNEVVSGIIETNTSWSADKIYELSGKVVVKSGATLTIAAGTIIKGQAGTGSLASALIVERGAKIMAVGTAAKPIIFTSTSDNITIGQLDGGNLTEFDNETWGGLVILGNAPVSVESSDVIGQIEGIPANETYGLYGGTEENDNSGVLQYISIRHGGALIGDGNEINGLTLGGVGAGTTIDHIEIFATLDDGVEFFGGTVNVTNVIVSYQGDDGIDIDQNYSGSVDNFAVIHGGSDTDEGLEIDGPEGSTYTTGKFTLSNGSLIAKDQIVTSGADLKSKAQGTIQNCSWTGYAKTIKIRSSFDPAGCASKSDAYTNMVAGNLVISNSEIVGGLMLSDMANAYSDTDPGEEDCFNAVASNYQTEVDNNIGLAGNGAVSSASRGANMSTFDGWTLSALRGLY